MYLGAGMHSSASSTSGMGRHICIDSINHHPLQQWHSKMLQNQQSSHLHDNLPHRHDVQLVQEGSDAMRLRYSWTSQRAPWSVKAAELSASIYSGL